MTPKLDSGREAAATADAPTLATEHDVRAFKMFRDTYVAFMDECSRLWHFYWHQVAEVSTLARERAMKAGSSPSPEEVASIEGDVAKAYRERADRLLGELQRALQAYAKGNASAWQAVGDKDAEWLMWHVGVGQSNAAAAYSTLLRALAS